MRESMTNRGENRIESAHPGQHLFCPHCGTEDVQDQEFCDHCGERVFAPDPNRHGRDVLATCSRCDATTLIHAKNCIGCGVALDRVRPTPAAERSPRPSHRDAAYATPDARGGMSTSYNRRRSRGRSGAPTWRRPDEQWPYPPGDAQDGDSSRSGESPRGSDEQEEPNDSGHRDAELPSELRGFNWGAFLLGPAWGLGNKVWIALPLFLIWFVPIPIQFPGGLLIYYGLTFFLAARGNELAWRSKRWSSVDHFRRTQRTWMKWGLAVAALNLMFGLVFLTKGPAAA